MHAQPSIWREWAPEIDDISAQIKIWIEQRNPQEVWFCGAGNSAFVGDTLAAYLGSNKHCLYRAISTTDYHLPLSRQLICMLRLIWVE